MKIAVLNFSDPLMDSLFRGFQGLEHEVLLIECEKSSAISIRSQLEKFEPDFAVTNNYYIFDTNDQSGAELEQYLEKAPWPFIVWYLEPPPCSGSAILVRRWHIGPYPKKFFFLSTDHFWVDFIRSKDIRCEYLPLAADQKLFEFHSTDIQEREFKIPLCFAGRSSELAMSSATFREGECRQLHLDKLKSEVAYGFLKFIQTDENLSKEIQDLWRHSGLAETLFGKFHNSAEAYREAKQKMTDRMKKMLPEAATEVFETIFSGRADLHYSFYKLEVSIAALLPIGLKLFGDEAWKKIFKGYEASTPRLPADDVLALFQNSTVTFCQTKMVFQEFVHDRVMATFALGGFPLTDDRSTVEEMFPGDGVAQYTSLEHAKELATFYIKNADARERIIDQGRARVLKEHTYFHRAKRMVELARKEFSL